MSNNTNLVNKAAMDDDYIDILALIKALWRRAWLIAVTAIVFAACAFGYAKFMITPLYSSSVVLYVNNNSISLGATSFSVSDLTAAKSLVDTYLAILNTRSTLQEVIQESGLTQYNYKQLRSMISSEAVNSTELFEIKVTCTDPDEAEELANTIAVVLPERIASIVDGSSVRIVEYAIKEPVKVSPSNRKYAMYGFMAGFLLVCGIIVVLELMDDKLKDDTHLLETYSDVPILAAIPDLREKSGNQYGYYGYGYGRRVKGDKSDE